MKAPANYLKAIITAFIFTSAPIISAVNPPPGENGMQTIYYIDTDRQRPLIADIYYPVDQENTAQTSLGSNTSGFHKSSSYPLIILSHGYGGSRKHLSWLAKVLSHHGYVVAALEHFGNTATFDDPKIALQRWLRPQDAHTFLDHFLSDPHWKAHIDQKRIAFAGYSLGGLAGIWLMGGIADQFAKPTIDKSSIYELAIGATQSDIDSIDYKISKSTFKDERIKAAFLMAPAHGFSFSQEGLKDIDKPIFIVVGENDRVTPIKENAEHYAHNIRSTELKVLSGNVSHLAFRNKVEPGKEKIV